MEVIFHFRFHGKRIFHFGIDNINLVQLVLHINPSIFCNISGTVQCRILNCIVKLCFYLKSFLCKILTSKLSDYKQLVVFMFKQCSSCHFHDIVIVCTRKSFIGCDHDITDAFFMSSGIFSSLVEIAVFVSGICVKILLIAIAAYRNTALYLPALLCAAKFRGRNHIHGTCDFHRIIDTFHSFPEFPWYLPCLIPAFIFFNCLNDLFL